MLPRCIAPLACPSLPHARRRSAAWLLAGALVLPAPAQPETPPSPGEDAWAGTYDVKGLTVDQRSGDTRRIEGHVVLSRKGDGWVAAAQLKTDYPTVGGPVHTDVIGNGEGTWSGGRLAGTAHTQLVIQTVPGVDTDFAYIPRVVGPRLVSDWTARLDRDGTLVVELTNRGEEGEDYAPTRTTLRGHRVQMPSERRD